MLTQQSLLEEAEPFIQQCYAELGKSPEEVSYRITEIEKQIGATGYYEHTYEELVHGAKMAWRNSNRCIGRLFWESLHVRDARQVDSEDEMNRELLGHIEYATNGGKIRPVITVFKPKYGTQNEARIWNHQLIRYAGYRTTQGVVGDPLSIEFTIQCQQLGWKGAGTAFDVLPLVVQLDGQAPKRYDIPSDLVLEVPIRHAEIQGFDDLDLKWYGVPIVSEMELEIGGIHYTAAPFNGWYMGTEIGARNLADQTRYNLLPRVAELMGLNMDSAATLWRDKALVELNIAVLDSYKRAGVSIVDHHTAASQFKTFEMREQSIGRAVTGDWTWLIPPVSPATTHIFHKSYDNHMMSPNFLYQKRPFG